MGDILADTFAGENIIRIPKRPCNILTQVPQNSDELNPGLTQNSKTNFFISKAF